MEVEKSPEPVRALRRSYRDGISKVIPEEKTFCRKVPRARKGIETPPLRGEGLRCKRGLRLARMKRAVGKVIRPRVDHVRYYYLCQSCLKKTEVTSGAEVLGEEEAIVV